ncbi:trigger factor [Actinomycetaceae bacterium MB13-C1-2]|nr:trigger factor [Actinomycetaceae bacterium MB13-C1-2]
MKSTAETLEPTKAKLVVEVDYDELKPAMDAAYKDIASQVNIPGFRQGHVPPRVIDQRFGRGMVIEQVVNQVLPEYLSQAILENNLRPLAQPEVDVKSVPNTEGEQGGKLEFEAILNIVPDFDLPDLADLELEVDPIEVADEDIDAELMELRTRFATLKPLDREAKDGDFLTLDITATVDDEEIDQLADVSYELGSGTMLEGQDEALRGAKSGDDITFTSTILGGEHAGKEATINVTVHGVKERELPEVDDDFAQMVSEFDTAAELREDTEKQVREGKRGAQALQARDILLDRLLDQTEILLPASVVDHEVEHRVGEDADEDAKEETKAGIEKDIRQQIFLDTLAQNREIQVGQQELVDFMMTTARNFGIDLNQMFSDQQQVQNMYGELARTKALVSVLADAKVKDTEGNEVDLTDFTTDRAQAEAEAAAAAAEAVEDDGSFSLNVDDLDGESK